MTGSSRKSNRHPSLGVGLRLMKVEVWLIRILSTTGDSRAAFTATGLRVGVP